jgi:hypothetical protein
MRRHERSQCLIGELDQQRGLVAPYLLRAPRQGSVLLIVGHGPNKKDGSVSLMGDPSARQAASAVATGLSIVAALVSSTSHFRFPHS